MNHTVSLTENHLFRRAYHRGRQSVHSALVLYALPNRLPVSRLGLTVSPKIGKAVVRNRVKRRLRESYRLEEGRLLPGFDLVIVARRRALTMPFDRLRGQLAAAARECRVLRP